MASKLKKSEKDRQSLTSQLIDGTKRLEEQLRVNDEAKKLVSQLKGKVGVLEALCRSLQEENDALAAAAVGFMASRYNVTKLMIIV